MRAGRGVLGRWVVRKVVSQVGDGVRDLVVVSWRDIWEERFGCVIELALVDREHYGSIGHMAQNDEMIARAIGQDRTSILSQSRGNPIHVRWHVRRLPQANKLRKSTPDGNINKPSARLLKRLIQPCHYLYSLGVLVTASLGASRSPVA